MEEAKKLTIYDLNKIGFKPIGKWIALENLKNSKRDSWKCRGKIDHEWSEEYKKFVTEKRDILYAFVFDDDIKYIGQSSDGVEGRFKHYVDPDKNPRNHATNKKCNKNIYNLVKPFNSGNKLDIWVFFPEEIKHNGYRVNLAVGLERNLIDLLKKSNTGCWNGMENKRKIPICEECGYRHID